MVKKIFPVLLIAIYSCGSNGDKKEVPQPTTPAGPSYTKSDLLKIKWIEGKWKGMDNEKPFYEIYRFLNDSTIESLGYEWDGTDSSHTTSSLISFQNGVYYLGDHQNWKVDSISETEIRMLPNKNASNDVLWRFRDSLHWDAILSSPKETKTYHMEHFDPFKK